MPGLFAPTRTLTRHKKTHNRPLQARQYAAAKTSRLTGDWAPVGQSVNQLLRASNNQVRNRVRQLVRDFPYFTRAANLLVDFTVGTGTVFQSRVLNPSWTPGSGGKGKFDRATCQRIEDAISWGMDELDASGHMHGHDLERLASRDDVEAGEFFLIRRQLNTPGRYIPYALQAVEAEWLCGSGDNVNMQSGALFDQGVEYDPDTGRAIAYHFTNPDNGRAIPVRVAAEHVIHGFETIRAGQIRGISPFVAGVLIANDLGDYIDATLDTAKLAAKYLALITTPDVASFQALRTQDGTGADQNKKIEDIENAIIEYLRPGESVEFAKNDNPGQTFKPFTDFVLKTIAVSTGVPFSALTANHGELNYTSLRGERQDIIKTLAPRQQRHIRQFMQPVVADIITSAVLAGKLDLPGYFKNPRIYQRGMYLPPGNEPIDPLKESKANRDDMGALLRSPQEIAARRGRDIEEVLDEHQEFAEMLAERGLQTDLGSTALANNPASLGATDNTKSISDIIARAIENALDRRDLLKED